MKEITRYEAESGEIFTNKFQAIEDDIIKKLRKKLYEINDEKKGALNNVGNNIKPIDRIIEYRDAIFTILTDVRNEYGDAF